MPWIAWFCSLGGHQYFAEVADDFVEDDFNLTGLNSIVPFYKEALEMILDLEPGKIASFPWCYVASLDPFPIHIFCVCFIILPLGTPINEQSIGALIEEDSTKVPDVSIVEASAEQLYGLIHQRFIVTRQGLQQMVRVVFFACVMGKEI